MKPLIIANWKMNFTLDEALNFIEQLPNSDDNADLMIAPPLAFLSHLKHQFSALEFIAQDVSIQSGNGSFTGENSAKLIASCGVKYSILGHSERRINFHETNHTIRRKVKNCMQAGITPIICVGETLEARKNNNYQEYILEQIRESIPEECKECIIAYEPVWAIGTGITPTNEEISKIAKLIKENSASTALAKRARLVYGGSASGKNCREILEIEHISGLLIGSSSLDIEEFKKILNV